MHPSLFVFDFGCLHTSVPVGVAVFPQGHLDVLDLLGDGRQHSLLQTIELVKTAPSANLTQSHKDTTHGLKGRRENQKVKIIHEHHQHNFKKKIRRMTFFDNCPIRLSSTLKLYLGLQLSNILVFRYRTENYLSYLSRYFDISIN